MAYIRKTRDTYDVEGNYGYGDGWEVVTAADTRKEAQDLRKDYRENRYTVSDQKEARTDQRLECRIKPPQTQTPATLTKHAPAPRTEPRRGKRKKRP